MNKKIIAIAIISMFLLTSFSVVSAKTINKAVDEKATSDETIIVTGNAVDKNGDPLYTIEMNSPIFDRYVFIKFYKSEDADYTHNYKGRDVTNKDGTFSLDIWEFYDLPDVVYYDVMVQTGGLHLGKKYFSERKSLEIEEGQTYDLGEIVVPMNGYNNRAAEPSFFSINGDVYISTEDIENLEIKVDGQPLNIDGIESDQVFKNVIITGTQLESDLPSYAFAPRCNFMATMIVAMTAIFQMLLPNIDIYSHIFNIFDILPGVYVFPTGEFIVNVGTMKDFCDTGFGGYIFNGLSIQIEE